jgi:hypothetical protein
VIVNDLLDGACTWIAKCDLLIALACVAHQKNRGRINGRQKEEEDREESCSRTGCSGASEEEGEEESQEDGEEESQEEGLIFPR